MTNTASQTPTFPEGSVRNLAISLDGLLGTTESLASVEIEELSDNPTEADLTIDNVAVSVAELTINHKTVATGRAVQCTVSGMITGSSYTLKITGTTNSSPPQVVPGFAKFSCDDR